MMRHRWIWAGLGILHLVLVVIGGFALKPPEAKGLLNDAFEFYGWLSGANLGYNFFAPEIGTELKVRFELDEDGRADRLEAGSSREAELRIGTLAYLIGDAIEDKAKRQKVAASFAGKVLSRNPDSKKVTVFIETYDLPSMEEYRQGKPLGWSLFYRAAFARRAE